MSNLPPKDAEGWGELPCFWPRMDTDSHGFKTKDLFYCVTLDAVAVGGKGGASYPVARSAGGGGGLGGAVQGLFVIDGFAGLGKDLGVAGVAFAVDTVVVEPVGEDGFSVGVLEVDGVGRRRIAERGRRGVGLRGGRGGRADIFLDRGGDHEKNGRQETAYEDYAEDVTHSLQCNFDAILAVL